jgi:hypothetical protein
MRLPLFALFFLVLSIPALADSPLIWTTNADSSNVSFIVSTPLDWDSVVHDGLRYIRFTDSPAADSVGYPEVPMITCLVAVPDSVTPSLEFSTSSERLHSVDPVYPAPAQILSHERTVAIVDSFVMDSTAYVSTAFWPATRARIIGETRICDQRLLKVQVFPALYRAADSLLSTVSSVSISISYDSSEAVWSNIGLGAFQGAAEDSPIVGYHPIAQSTAPVPDYFGVVDPYNGPQPPGSRMPDYVIICASGLYDDCSDAIDDLAEHRVSTNQFDVATVLTDDILDDFGSGAQVLTDGILRDFTEHMWDNWPQATTRKPSYLLLIGDHEDPSYGSADWFLPTHQYDDLLFLDDTVYNVANDEWYAYPDLDRRINNAIPSMAVGRVSIKNGSRTQTDTLSTILANLIDMEDPITQIPSPNYRRRVVRLAGTGKDDDSGHQTYVSWGPSEDWTESFTDWLGYGCTSEYCGDGRDFTSIDGSEMASWQWRERCLAEYGRGAGVIFYSNHGAFHMFSAGLEWVPGLIPEDPYTKGARDSTFNSYQVDNYLTAAQEHAPPFTLLLCCSSGTFNHTVAEHQDSTATHPRFCSFEGSTSPPVPAYDFGSDCLGERLGKNTDTPVSGVLCGSRSSNTGCYVVYGEGILEGIYVYGTGRLGDAIMSARLGGESGFSSQGEGNLWLGQFNLLGDPALDVSDYIRFPDDCDLVAYQEDLDVSVYPVETSAGVQMDIGFTIRNNGRQDSDGFSTKITITDGSYTSVDYISCTAIESGSSETYSYEWDCPGWFVPPVELDVEIEADHAQSCDDSWWPNNSASGSFQINDTYPFESGWPVEVYGNVTTTPMLVNLDIDSYLEVAVLAGNHLTAYDHQGDLLWVVYDEGFASGDQPTFADLDQDGDNELVAACEDGIKTISNTGTVLDALETANGVFVVGDMHPRSGLELCTADDNILYLYNWNSSVSGFESVASHDLGFQRERPAISMSCNDVDGDSYDDVAYLNGFTEGSFPPKPERTSVTAYDWEGASTLYSYTWDEYANASVVLCAGKLAGTGSIGNPSGTYDQTGDPAMLIEPDEAIEEVSCSGTNVLSAQKLYYGVFADWAAAAGADAFVLPSERQCMAWNVDGEGISGWPTDEFGGASIGSPIGPTSLGDINGDDETDVVFSTVLDGNWTLTGLGPDGNPLEDALDFPYTLPEGVTAYGGIAISDIDRDGTVEILFGTDDGLLHCWQLGSCSTGYAPWPQFQHDPGRSGLLE